MKGDTLRSEIYRFWMRKVVQRWIIPRVVPRDRIVTGEMEWKSFFSSRGDASPPEGRDGKPRIWFHAASVGELESLWPVVLEAAREISGLELILTVFSRSARGRLDVLRDALVSGESGSARVVFLGYSPWEGAWREALRALRPDLFVTVRYEAWPELWGALSVSGIPLVIVGARVRRSLRICKHFCGALGLALPDLTLLPALEREVEELSRLFPEAKVRAVGEPRWDQVFARSRIGSGRARELIQSASALARPWGLLGSAWREDLDAWKGILSGRWEGTLWIVPHRVDRQYVSEMEEFLKALGIRAFRTSDIGVLRSEPGASSIAAPPPDTEVVLVDEAGFLLELYSGADWAYVGGGFGAGVHSTIEPAIQGIPIAVGPLGTEKFAEITELRESRQLSLVNGSRDLESWLARVRDEAPALRQGWIEQAKARRGATRNVVGILERALSSSARLAGSNPKMLG